MVLTDFRKAMETLINNSGLSIDCIYFVMKDVFNEVTQIYNDIKTQEEIELQKKLEEEKEQDDKEETEDETD